MGLLCDLPARIARDGSLTLQEAEARCEALESDVQTVLGECLEAVQSELRCADPPSESTTGSTTQLTTTLTTSVTAVPFSRLLTLTTDSNRV